jgi:hypothetical protein
MLGRQRPAGCWRAQAPSAALVAELCCGSCGRRCRSIKLPAAAGECEDTGAARPRVLGLTGAVLQLERLAAGVWVWVLCGAQVCERAGFVLLSAVPACRRQCR